jgi:hypothetical protein
VNEKRLWIAFGCLLFVGLVVAIVVINRSMQPSQAASVIAPEPAAPAGRHGAAPVVAAEKVPDVPKPQHAAPRDPPPKPAAPVDSFVAGDATIRIVGYGLGKIPLHSEGSTEVGESADQLLWVKVEIENRSDVHKLNYAPWTSGALIFGRDYASMDDTVGNHYKRIDFGLITWPVGEMRSQQSIYPHKKVADVLVFEAPVDQVEHFQLTLPLSNVGGEGKWKFPIERTNFGSSP